MSDNEYNSDSDSGSNKSDDDLVVSKKIVFKPSIIKQAKSYDDADDSEPDDSEPDNSDDEDEDEEDDNIIENIKQKGGVDDYLDDNGSVYENAGDDEDDEEDDDDDDDDDIEIDDDGEPIEKKPVKPSKITKPKKTQLIVEDDDDDYDDEYDENYLQKFDNDLIKTYVSEFHPECLNHNNEEILKLSVVTRNENGIIIDPLHRTIPFLTKYEKTRILGQRSKQIESGAKPLVKVPENVIDSYIIAELELREKKIPFIIRRPIPGGACEYWNIRDLEYIGF
jgi:DNA-directed RNA polymerase I, II, and III subunit RPABC2